MANDTDQKKKTAPPPLSPLTALQRDVRLKPQNNPPSQTDAKNLYLEIRALLTGEGDSVYDIPRKWCYGNLSDCQNSIS